MDSVTVLLSALKAVIHDPVFWAMIALFLLYYIFAAAVGSMDMPTPQSSARYKFWFKFLNRLSANITRAVVAHKLVAAVDNDAPKPDNPTQ